jgi:hypothetical protein
MLLSIDILTKNDVSLVTSLPRFLYENSEKCAEELRKEGSVSLKDLALFFDEERGELQPFSSISQHSEVLSKPTFLGNLVVVNRTGKNVPMFILVEDFETGDPMIFGLAAFHDNYNAYVKRKKNEWYLTTEDQIQPVGEAHIRNLDVSKKLIVAYYYRQNSQ